MTTNGRKVDVMLSRVRELLVTHRPDGLKNLTAVTLLNWTDVAGVLTLLAESATHEDERPFARRAADWLEVRGLGSRTV